jgi:hypothetical protein
MRAARIAAKVPLHPPPTTHRSTLAATGIDREGSERKDVGFMLTVSTHAQKYSIVSGAETSTDSCYM